MHRTFVYSKGDYCDYSTPKALYTYKRVLLIYVKLKKCGSAVEACPWAFSFGTAGHAKLVYLFASSGEDGVLVIHMLSHPITKDNIV
ncbi:hypothetical protein AN958_11252 [Leucoagaricus sp. SymC.cos]|nr:hypothetical protein AN958_11252 [Leucoagaricus sp. SymC.cos]